MTAGPLAGERRAACGLWRLPPGGRSRRIMLSVGVGACLLACTDPRARPAPPSVTLFVSSGLRISSPGTIPTSISATDAQGLDSLVVSLRSTYGPLHGDSTYLLRDTTEQTTAVVWSVPGGVPGGTTIVLAAIAYNLVGFAARDSAVVTVVQ
jgi:hypothetical protein